MKFRFTQKELDEWSDERLLLALVDERISDLNPYSPLSRRLREVRKNLQSRRRIHRKGH